MKKLALALCAATALTACVSVQSLMQSKIGHDISEVMAEYGPPEAQFDLPDGRRAFQWAIHKQKTLGNAYTNTWGYLTNTQANTTTYTSSCRYTLYAEPNGRSWTVVGYEPPKASCGYIIQ